MNFRKSRNEPLELLDELAYMLYKPKKGQLTLEHVLIDALIAYNSKFSNALALQYLHILFHDGYIVVGDWSNTKPLYRFTTKGWDSLTLKTYIIIHEHLNGIQTTRWMKVKRFFGIL